MARRADGFSTRAVHVGHEADPVTGAVGVPIHQVSTFQHPRRRDASGRWVPNPEWIYTRWANPTVAAVQRKMASLEGAEASLAFASGMAAISSSILAHAGAGHEVVAMSAIYGGTVSLLTRQMPHLGVKVRFVDGADAAQLAEAVDGSTRAVYVETPTNPFNRVVDVGDLVRRLARRHGKERPSVLVDATFASPVNLRPLESGADLVVHSATKYLNGHSDVIAGMASGATAQVESLVPWMRNLGASMDPHQAFLLSRGMRTLPLRMQAHNANALEVARFLSERRDVKQVWYAGLKDHPDHRVARRTMDGYGGIVSFRLATSRATRARRFLEGLRLFQAAPSLGGVESLATIPAETSHSYLSPRELGAAGLSKTFIRLAVGVEDVQDLVADLRQALHRAA